MRRGCRGAIAVVAATVLLTAAPAAATGGGLVRDTMQLTDAPGSWFRSETSGTPVSTVGVGGRVDFVAGELTNTRHTATLVIKPPGSGLSVDQDAAKSGGVASAEFDVPGVYLFLCKVHPYMTGVVAVEDERGDVPPVAAEQLPFIGHLGAASLPAGAVLGVLPTVAPTDADKQAKWDIRSRGDAFRPPVPGSARCGSIASSRRWPGRRTSGAYRSRARSPWWTPPASRSSTR
jgi:plastocyanin